LRAARRTPPSFEDPEDDESSVWVFVFAILAFATRAEAQSTQDEAAVRELPQAFSRALIST
jgi:hypothetical protein